MRKKIVGERKCKRCIGTISKDPVMQCSILEYQSLSKVSKKSVGNIHRCTNCGVLYHSNNRPLKIRLTVTGGEKIVTNVFATLSRDADFVTYSVWAVEVGQMTLTRNKIALATLRNPVNYLF